MDAIQTTLRPSRATARGYTPAYFLSARFNLHRNYAEHYLGKGDLTNRDINHILAAIAPNKRLCLMPPYADTLYNRVQEPPHRRRRRTGRPAEDLAGKNVLVWVPGGSPLPRLAVPL